MPLLIELVNTLVKAHIALVLVALIYGANYSIAKLVLDDQYIQPLGFILLRVSIAAIFFSIVQPIFVREKVKRKDLGLMALCAVFGIATNQMFFFMGLKLTTPINASLIMTINPILVLVISAIVLGELITRRKLVGIFLGLSGAAYLILYGKSLQFSNDGYLGDLLIFINATSYGIYLVLVKSLMAKYHPVTVMRWLFFFGFFMVFPFGYSGLASVDWSSFNLTIWMAVAYVILFSTITVYLLNVYALAFVNASTASIYIYLQPLIASIIAILMQKDTLTLPKILAGLLIFTGVYLVSIRKKINSTA